MGQRPRREIRRSSGPSAAIRRATKREMATSRLWHGLGRRESVSLCLYARLPCMALHVHCRSLQLTLGAERGGEAERRQLETLCEGPREGKLKRSRRTEIWREAGRIGIGGRRLALAQWWAWWGRRTRVPFAASFLDPSICLCVAVRCRRRSSCPSHLRRRPVTICYCSLSRSLTDSVILQHPPAGQSASPLALSRCLPAVSLPSG